MVSKDGANTPHQARSEFSTHAENYTTNKCPPFLLPKPRM